MLLKKKNHLIGLDIGSRSIKVGETVETKNDFELNKFGMVDISAGWIEDAAIKEPERIAETIRDLLNREKIKEKNVAVSIGGYSVIVKKIQLPPQSEESLQDSIHFEAEQYIPFDINEVNLDFQILSDPADGNQRMDVILVAAKKDLVNDYINLLSLAGLRPSIIDIDAFALQNIYEYAYAPQDETVALIDIGACKTSLNILKGTISLFMRDVTLGSEQINHKIRDVAQCSLDDAESIKLGDKPGDQFSGLDLKQITTDVVSDWCLEIRRAIDFFYSTYPEHQIKTAILSGGGANISEFRNMLASEIAMDVEPIRPFSRFTVHRRFDNAWLESVSSQAAICMGLAIRRQGDK
ncbi:MAG: type IV pilus biogenesis protein PilM [Desulfatirhabdiaceae bacterium]